MVSTITQQLLNVIMLGSLYSLVAIGFTLFFGVLDLINFAHGDVFMLGSFVALFLFMTFAFFSSLNFFTVLLLFVITGFIVVISGLLIYKLTIKPLAESPPLMMLLVTVGVSIFIREGVMLFFPDGASPHAFPKIFPEVTYKFLVMNIPAGYIFIIAISIILVVAMSLFVNKTKLGMSIRATAQDREAALMMGVDIDKTIAVTFIIGSLLAGIGGILNGAYYSTIKYDMGFVAGIKGFSCSVVVGLGNVYGAIVGSFVIAFLETVGAAFLPLGAEYKDVFTFIIVIIFLVIRPSGLMGEKKFEKV